MPELPEVENYRRYLNDHALRQRIAEVRVSERRVLRNTTPEKLARGLAHHELTQTRRHGKHLLVALDGDEGWLALHFGMTGRLAYFDDPRADPDNDRVRLDFENGSHLAYVDARMLGSVELAADIDAFIEHRNLGPDALSDDLDEAAFDELLATRRGGIKSALMDQSLIAGIGNLYADEILFQAKLHPLARTQDLSPAERKRIHTKMREILQTAINSGAGSKGFYKRLPKSFLIPHRAAGATCPRCGGTVEMITAAGRSTYFCGACQRVADR
jgi:formamidopyrimidine-DNA glycosylase